MKVSREQRLERALLEYVEKYPMTKAARDVLSETSLDAKNEVEIRSEYTYEHHVHSNLK